MRSCGPGGVEVPGVDPHRGRHHDSVGHVRRAHELECRAELQLDLDGTPAVS